MPLQTVKVSMFIALLALATAPHAKAAEPQVGQPAPQFELQDTQGRIHKLSDYQGRIVVLHFQSTRCPWDKAYQPILNGIAQRITAMNNDMPESIGVKFLGINANRTEDVVEIDQYTQSANMPYPVLKDPGNVIADAYNAKTTPHIYIINNDQQQTLAYKGGIEKAPLSYDQCGTSDEQYLEPILKAMLHGDAIPVTETRSIGCSIKREE